MSRDIALSRQSAIIDIPDDFNVLMIGAGSVGSSVALMLARIGVQNITIYDPDVVGEENVHPSSFHRADIGLSKVDAVKKDVETFGCKVTAVQDFYKGGPIKEKFYVTVVSPDNMRARRIVWKAIQDGKLTTLLFMDARMSGWGGGVYSMDLTEPNADFSWYEKTLDVENNELPCGEKNTASITAGILPGMVGQVVTHFVNAVDIPKELYYNGQGQSFFSVTGK